MKINPVASAVNSAEMIANLMDKIEKTTTGIVNNPTLSQSPAQINRTVEISRDPPVTVLKYTNELTKQIELQIPSEVSLRLYKTTQEYIKRQEENKNLVNIKI